MRKDSKFIVIGVAWLYLCISHGDNQKLNYLLIFILYKNGDHFAENFLNAYADYVYIHQQFDGGFQNSKQKISI